MTVTHVIGGRAAGISWGYAHELPRALVMLANFLVEVFLVMLFYPLFVLSYRKLIIIEPLKDALERAQEAARAHERQVLRWGVPGLLLFVLFPFWMTGPVVGCIIGFLIGLRPWVNLTVVLSGTGLAIVCWGVLLETLQRKLEALGPLVPFLFVGLILFLAVAVRVRLAFRHPRRPAEGPRSEEGSPPDAAEPGRPGCAPGPRGASPRRGGGRPL